MAAQSFPRHSSWHAAGYACSRKPDRLESHHNRFRGKTMRKLSHTRWLLAALAAAALGPPEAAAQTAPRDTGLILSSMEAAVRVPVERRENLRVTIDLSDRKLYVTSGRSEEH